MSTKIGPTDDRVNAPNGASTASAQIHEIFAARATEATYLHLAIPDSAIGKEIRLRGLSGRPTRAGPWTYSVERRQRPPKLPILLLPPGFPLVLIRDSEVRRRLHRSKVFAEFHGGDRILLPDLQNPGLKVLKRGFRTWSVQRRWSQMPISRRYRVPTN